MRNLFELVNRTQEDDLAQAFRDGAPEEVILKMISSPTLKGSWVNIGKEYISPIATENFIYLATINAPKNNPKNMPCYSLDIQRALIQKGSDAFWDFPIQGRHFPYSCALLEGFIRGVYSKDLIRDHKTLDYHRFYDDSAEGSYYALNSLYPLFEAIQDEDRAHRYSFNFLTTALSNDAYLPTCEDLENLLEFRPEFLRKQKEGSFDNPHETSPYETMTFEPLDILLYKDCRHVCVQDEKGHPITSERLNSLNNHLKLMKLIIDKGGQVTETLFQKYLDKAIKDQSFDATVSEKISALITYKLHLTDETYHKIHKYLRAQTVHQNNQEQQNKHGAQNFIRQIQKPRD